MIFLIYAIIAAGVTCIADMYMHTDAIAQQIMFAEKSWGSYRVLDAGENSLTVRLTLLPGRRMSFHSHDRRDEVWTVVSGSGRSYQQQSISRQSMCPVDLDNGFDDTLFDTLHAVEFFIQNAPCFCIRISRPKPRLSAARVAASWR